MIDKLLIINYLWINKKNPDQISLKKVGYTLLICFLFTISAINNVYGCFDAPNADFSSSTTTRCINQTVTFTDQTDYNDLSISNASWSWNFGANATPTTANTRGPHDVTYSVAGQKTVSLTVSWSVEGGGSDTETKTNYITVNALPATPTNPIATPATICGGASSTLSATVGSGQTVDWFIGSCGGIAVASPVSPTTTTTYYARARNTTTSCVSAACASVTVTVNTPPTAPTSITGTTTICSGQSTTLAASGGTEGSGCTYQWYVEGCGSGSLLGTNSSLSVTPATSTTYYVRRVGTSPCNGTVTGCASVTVTVNPLPTFNVEVTNVSCYGGNDGSIKVTVLTGTPNYRFSKDGGSNWTGWQSGTEYTFSNLNVAGGPYDIQVQDGNSCTQVNCTVP